MMPCRSTGFAWLTCPRRTEEQRSCGRGTQLRYVVDVDDALDITCPRWVVEAPIWTCLTRHLALHISMESGSVAFGGPLLARGSANGAVLVVKVREGQPADGRLRVASPTASIVPGFRGYGRMLGFGLAYSTD
jgi:hypothetical protein